MLTGRRRKIAIAFIFVLMIGACISFAFESYDRYRRYQALELRIEALEVQLAKSKKLIAP